MFWQLLPRLNWGHQFFQNCALPTELSSYDLARQDRLERSTATLEEWSSIHLSYWRKFWTGLRELHPYENLGRVPCWLLNIKAGYINKGVVGAPDSHAGPTVLHSYLQILNYRTPAALSRRGRFYRACHPNLFVNW